MGIELKGLCIIAALALLSTTAFGDIAPKLPPLKVKGAQMVDPSGKPVSLQGCNLGNWLMLEMWMLGFTEGPHKVDDQYELISILNQRFGREESRRLMDVYRSSWITERDFELVKSYKFNLVRLPFDYRLLEDDDSPMVLRKDAWRWLDRAVDLAEKHGLYIILDMHGAPGGQSVYDHTGQSGQNKLWSVPQNQERYCWLWTKIASRYHGRPNVVAYDVLNEPYGGTHEGQVALFDKVYKAIRSVDKDTLIWIPSHFDGFAHYGDPKDHGWKNVGITEHHYPGLFGNGDPTVLNHTRFLKGLALKAAEIKKLNVPYLIGEMNVVFKAADGPSMMRRYYDAHKGYGWWTTMWSYKAESKEGGIGDGGSWGMVTCKKPLRTIDLRSATKAEIEAFFKSYATEEYEVYEELRQALSAANPTLKPLPVIPDPISSVPYQDTLEGWTSVDLGGALKGGVHDLAGGRFELYGGGEDVWGKSDQCRFLYQKRSGDFTAEVTIEGLEDVAAYTKAGLMIRGSLEPDAPTVLLSSFASGELQLAVRPASGEDMQGKETSPGKFPRKVRLVRAGLTVTAFYAKGSDWVKMGEVSVPGFGREVFVGLISLSHDNRQLGKATYSMLVVK